MVGTHIPWNTMSFWGGDATVDSSDEQADSNDRSADTWSLLRGALKDIFAELGGGEAYLQTERAEFHNREER